MVSKATAKALTYIGALAALLCALAPLRGLFAGTEQGVVVVPRTIALLLGGAGFIYGKRAGTVTLVAFILAMRMGNGSHELQPVDFLILAGACLGVSGIFALHRHAKLSRGGKAPKHIDENLAISFTRISAAAGLSFGPLLWMFSMAVMNGLSAANSTSGLLITLFAWQTLKRQLWAAVAQLILAAGNLVLAYTDPAGPMSVFTFFPLFLLMVHTLGVIGVANLKTSRRHGDRASSAVTASKP